MDLSDVPVFRELVELAKEDEDVVETDFDIQGLFEEAIAGLNRGADPEGCLEGIRKHILLSVGRHEARPSVDGVGESRSGSAGRRHPLVVVYPGDQNLPCPQTAIVFADKLNGGHGALALVTRLINTCRPDPLRRILLIGRAEAMANIVTRQGDRCPWFGGLIAGHNIGALPSSAGGMPGRPLVVSLLCLVVTNGVWELKRKEYCCY